MLGRSLGDDDEGCGLIERERPPGGPVLAITSAGNPRVKLLRGLAASRGARRHQRALVCGRRIVDEVARRHPGRVESLVFPAGDPGLAAWATGRGGATQPAACRPALPPSEPAGWEILVLPPALFRDLDPFGVEPPLAVVRVEPLVPWSPEAEAEGLTLLLPLGDPENVGAALRSAAAFAVDRVVLLEQAAHPFHPRAIRASSGACFDVELRSGPALADLARSVPRGLEVLVLDRGGEPITGIAPAERRALVVGEEGGAAPTGPGLRRVSIPISDRVESLNAAVAVGIALWELRRPR